ncbi:MAG: hypothetical protein QM498_03580 [Desulfobacterium sp.]
MDHISFKALVEKVGELKIQGTKWHFHMIGPKCIFNRIENKFELFIENEITGEMWSSLFDKRPVAQTRQMAEMAYGADFLSKKDNSSSDEKSPIVNDVFMKIMANAKECHATHTAWHNHHLLPQCHLNNRKGSHCIVFENETRGNTLFAYFDEDPIDELSQLESIYFSGSSQG